MNLGRHEWRDGRLSWRSPSGLRNDAGLKPCATHGENVQISRWAKRVGRSSGPARGGEVCGRTATIRVVGTAAAITKAAAGARVGATCTFDSIGPP